MMVAPSSGQSSHELAIVEKKLEQMGILPNLIIVLAFLNNLQNNRRPVFKSAL